MTTNLYQAHRQWAKRPADERFASLGGLYEFTKSRRIRSSENLRELKSLEIKQYSENSLMINGNTEPAQFTNWGFGQLSTIIGAPANYLRTLPANMVKDCMEYGLRKSKGFTKILTRGNNGNSLASAFTSKSYGRIWDSNVVEMIMNSTLGSSWHTPPSATDDITSNGLYASDRDMFVFMVNDENPVEVENAKLGRGFFCWNSETGASTFGLTTFLYNYVCGNHIVWGAEDIQELKIVHKNHALDRYHTIVKPTLNRFLVSKSLDDKIKDGIWAASKIRIGDNQEQTLEWFKNRPFTKKEVLLGREKGISEGEDVSNLWGMVQGLTAHARDIPYTDRRVNLERRAGKLLGCD
ncbi:MAG: hypothetical protein ACFFCI_08860 [Promethearchaeota archaeon]